MTKCIELGLEPQAEATRSLIVQRTPGRNTLFLTPRDNVPALADDASTVVRKWDEKLSEVRREGAQQLLQLAEEALQQNEPALAYQLLFEVLHFDSQQPDARAILGHATGSAAGSRFDRPSTQRARTRHPQLGWEPGTYWRVSSRSYQIVTDDDEEGALDLAARLEDLQAAWRQLFFECWSDQRSLAYAWKRKRVLRPQSRGRFRVVLFRDREEYVRHLRPQQPQIEITLGFYDDQRKTAFFFAGDRSADSTLLHEATHQLFHESQRTVPRIAEDGNFWVVEGVALYMESLRGHIGFVTLGGFEAERLQFARYRALQEGFYVPLDQLVTLGRSGIQQDPRIRRIYSQSAGITQFLMDHQGGHYRPGLIDYIRRVYAGRDGKNSLAEATDSPLAQLDGEYREFLQVDDDQLATLPSTAQVTKLCLGNTRVTDKGLATLQGQSTLEWLDLARTATTDVGFKSLSEARQLRQLNLESTAVTDASMSIVGRFHTLEELDLSHTGVTDEGLRELSGLSRLRALLLTGTQVTDAGLSALQGLKELETLDVTDTNVSSDGWAAIARLLPRLKAE